jgi:hypothetical protein
MAAGEDMAIRFYKKGNAVELAEQLIAILQSPELQRNMASHNFAAGVEMTMTSVIKNYLRWFELQKCKRAMRTAGVIPGFRRLSVETPRASVASAEWRVPPALLVQQQKDMDTGQENTLAGIYTQVDNGLDSSVWTNPQALKDQSNGDLD